MKVHLIRHGESMSNAGLIDSRDSTLSPLGEQQASLTGEALQGAGIELLFCSLMDRALHTAQLISQAADIPVRIWSDLCELGYCYQEKGLPRSALERKYAGLPFPDEADEEGWARHREGETREETFVRMKPVADRLLGLCREGAHATVACVIHGRSGNELIKHLLRVPFESPFTVHHGNCGITTLQLEPEYTHVLAVNDLRHLSALRTDGPAAAQYT
ncbi:histidine phosphatase family protein [Gorillibacterium sp. sgz5001074]|uniref:histidine phosphatase family protein n=1 Tax=Gorillibacterium sp. sgz5001074 TaxID=3446695 RepID=UPI003F6626FF